MNFNHHCSLIYTEPLANVHLCYDIMPYDHNIEGMFEDYEASVVSVRVCLVFVFSIVY